MSTDIFTKRGITPPWEPEGHVARAQGFERYEGDTWSERRALIAQRERLYGSDEHPDPTKPRQLWERRVEKALGPLGRTAVTRYLDAGFAPRKEAAELARADARLERSTREAWTYWLRRVLAADGWLMPRHAIMPDHPDSDFSAKPVAQLRPDEPAILAPTGYKWHQHWHDLRASERRSHESKVCEPAPPGHRAAIDHPRGAFLPTGHLHPATGEIVVPFEGRHRHWDHAKYVYTPGKTAKRLGANPLNIERGYEGDLFVVVLEGTLKMCSVTEAGYPCVDAGSVTLWGSSTIEAEYDEDGTLEGGQMLELVEFAERHLSGRPVAVVCDSDWYSNELVREQTDAVAALLRPYVADVFACAPPEGKSYGWRHPRTNVEQREKRGVDDWLGEHAREDRHHAFLEIGRFEQAQAAKLTVDDPRLLVPREDGRRPRIDGRRTTVEVVRAMGERASPVDRVAPYALNELATSLGRPTSRVQDGYARAVAAGLLEPLTEAVRRSDGRSVRTEAALVRVAPEGMPAHRWRSLREWLG